MKVKQLKKVVGALHLPSIEVSMLVVTILCMYPIIVQAFCHGHTQF